MLEERCLFLLMYKKEQAIDEYYRQVGGGWLFLWHFRGNINFLPRRAFLGGAVTDFLPIQWKNAPGRASVTVNGEG